jgi:hypothetical protein
MKIISISICLGTLLLISSALPAETLFEESFKNTAAQAANRNLASIGWHGYGGSQGKDLTEASGAELNSLLIAWGRGNPADSRGFLGVIMSRKAPNFEDYTAIKTGLILKDPCTISWRMHAGKGQTLRSRILVQVEGKWYASAEVFQATAFGLAEDFVSAEVAAVEKKLTYTTDELDWLEFVLTSEQAIAVGGAPAKPLPKTPVTGVGFYLYGGGTGRIDSLRITNKP